MRYAVAFKDRL